MHPLRKLRVSVSLSLRISRPAHIVARAAVLAPAAALAEEHLVGGQPMRLLDEPFTAGR
jgi:hypothetical protein